MRFAGGWNGQGSITTKGLSLEEVMDHIINPNDLDMYHSHGEDLLKKDHAYRCFCDAAQLAATRLRLQQSGSMAGYDRTCRKLGPDDVKHNLSLGKPFCVRLSVCVVC